MNKRAKIIKFVSLNKKQIIFALFALLYFLDNNNLNEVYKSAAPAVAAIAAKGVEAAKALKAAKTAKEAGETAKAVKEAATAAKNINEAAGTAKQIHDAKKREQDPETLEDAKKENRRQNRRMLVNVATSALNIPRNNNIPRNTNPNPNAITPRSENNSSNDSLSNENSPLKNIFKGNKLKNLFNGDNANANVEESINMESASNIIPKVGFLGKIGCGLILLFAIILLIPAMLFSEISNTFTATTFLNNVVDNDTQEEVNFFKTLSEKFENALKYHYFASNKETFNKKINDTYEKIYKTYGVPLDIPLLLSTLLTDYDSLIPEIDENNQTVISKETMRKLEYVEDLAKLQIDEGNDIYLCSSKEVDGKMVYYTINYTGTVDESLIVSTCNSDNVGKYIKSSGTTIDSENYFEKLKDNVILTLLYPDYELSPSLIIDKIKSQYQVYELMYVQSEDDDEYAVPSDLLYDTNINMQAPLRGKITITSPFGGRGEVYKNGQLVSTGAHNGIDLYASDRSIYSAGNGTVYRTYYESTGGNIVEILHTTASGKRYISQYAHLSQILVSKDEEVTVGDLIAIMGCTGSACTGPHLHFGIKDLDSNQWLNPKTIVEKAIN